MVKNRYICLLVVLISEPLSAQFLSQSSIPTGIVPSKNLIYYSDILTYINPAAAPLKGKFTFNSKIAGFSGVRKDQRELYFDTWLKFKEKEKLSLGLQFYSNNQGTYIRHQSGKFYSRYSIHLSEKWKISTALGLGFLSYAFEGNDVIAGGADIVPDVDAGIAIQSDRWNIGIARIHSIDSKLQPIFATFSKNRLINAHLGKEFRATSTIDLKVLLVASYNLTTSQIESDFTLESIYKKKFKLITLLYHTEIIGLGGGIQEIETGIGTFGFNFIYSYGINRRYSVVSNRYELGLSYLIKRSN